MKRITFLILIIFSTSCGKENKIGEKFSIIKDSRCFSEEELAKVAIQNGNLKCFIGVSASSNYETVIETQKLLKKKNIEVDFVIPTCIPPKGVQNCYEEYINLEFVKRMGKSTINTIQKAFEEVGVKTYTVKKY